MNIDQSFKLLIQENLKDAKFELYLHLQVTHAG